MTEKEAEDLYAEIYEEAELAACERDSPYSPGFESLVRSIANDLCHQRDLPATF